MGKTPIQKTCHNILHSVSARRIAQVVGLTFAVIGGLFGLIFIALVVGGPPVTEKIATNFFRALGFETVIIDIAEVTPRHIVLRELSLGNDESTPEFALEDARISYNVSTLWRGQVENFSAQSLSASAHYEDGVLRFGALENLVQALSGEGTTSTSYKAWPDIDLKQFDFTLHTPVGAVAFHSPVKVTPRPDGGVSVVAKGLLKGTDAQAPLECIVTLNLTPEGMAEGEIAISPGLFKLERSEAQIVSAYISFRTRGAEPTYLKGEINIASLAVRDTQAEKIALSFESHSADSYLPLRIAGQVNGLSRVDLPLTDVQVQANLFQNEGDEFELRFFDTAEAQLQIEDPLAEGRKLKVLLSLSHANEDQSFLTLGNSTNKDEVATLQVDAAFSAKGGARFSGQGKVQGSSSLSAGDFQVNKLLLEKLRFDRLVVRDAGQPSKEMTFQPLNVSVKQENESFGGELDGRVSLKENGSDTDWLNIVLAGSFQITETDLSLYSKIYDVARHEVATLTLNHDSGRGVGKLALVSEKRFLGPDTIQPLLTVPFVSKYIDSLLGEISFQVDAQWRPNDLTASGQFGLHNIALSQGEIVASGISGTVLFSSLVPLETPGAQTLEIGQLEAGLPLENGTVSASFQGDEGIAIQSLRFPFSKGFLSLEPVTIKPNESQPPVVLKVESVDVEDLLAGLELEGLMGTGTLSGRLPIVSKDETLFVEGGILETEGPGVLRYQSDTSQAVRQGRKESDILFQALENFHYNKAVLRLDGELTGDLEARLAIEGANPNVYDGYPIKLNVSVESPFAALWRQGISTVRGSSVFDMIKDQPIEAPAN